MPDALARADKKRQSLAVHLTADEHDRLMKARRVAIEAAELYAALVWRASVDIQREQRKEASRVKK